MLIQVKKIIEVYNMTQRCHIMFDTMYKKISNRRAIIHMCNLINRTARIFVILLCFVLR